MERRALYAQRAATRHTMLFTLTGGATGFLVSGPAAYFAVVQWGLGGGVGVWALYLILGWGLWRWVERKGASKILRLPLLAWLVGSALVFLYLVRQLSGTTA